MIWRLIFSLALISSCGGIVSTADGGPDGGGMDASAGDGWTQCTSPDNFAVCGGPNDCRPANCGCNHPQCSDCVPINTNVDGAPGYCPPNPFVAAGTALCGPGVDGMVCVSTNLGQSTPSFWAEVPFDMGVLLANDGYADYVRYADMGKWTGDPLPSPTSCPSLGAVLPCGGACGACPAGSTCMGRSPLHPVGFCHPDADGRCDLPTPGCNGGMSCFNYVVQPQVQADADQSGVCLPPADCQALAQAIPGGGKCTP